MAAREEGKDGISTAAGSHFARKFSLVTGGATGIGRATSIALASRGAAVTIASRRQDRGDAIVEEIRALGGSAEFVRTGVADAEALAALHDSILDRHGRLDIAFNNAGFQEARASVATQERSAYDRRKYPQTVLLGGNSLGSMAPRTASPDEIRDRVQHLTQIPLSSPTTVSRWR